MTAWRHAHLHSNTKQYLHYLSIYYSFTLKSIHLSCCVSLNIAEGEGDFGEMSGRNMNTLLKDLCALPDLTSWSMAEAVRGGGLWYFDDTASTKSMGDVRSIRSYSLLWRWGEMTSPAEVQAEPPEPSELMKEPLSWETRCVSIPPKSVGVGGQSGPCSRLLDLINFFSFRVIQFPRLRKGRFKHKEEINISTIRCDFG